MKHLLKNKFLVILALAVLLILTLGGCGGGSDETSEELPLTDADSGRVSWDALNAYASEFVELMAQGDFSTATAIFNDEVSAVVDATALEEVWQHIVAQAGTFVAVYEIENVEADGLYLVLVTSQHEASGVTLTLRFSADGLIAGFTIDNFPTLGETEVAETVGFTAYPIIIGERTDWPLDGMLSMPDDTTIPVPAVVIVQGSGPNDMDGSMSFHIYREIAQYLAANGIASIRHDKRILTHRAITPNMPPDYTIMDEAIDDALLSAEMLRADPRIDENRVFIIGHSLGASIAPRIHAMGGNFSGLILMAGTPRDPFGELMFEQLTTAVAQAVEMAVIDEADADVQLGALQEAAELFASVLYMTEDEARTFPLPIVSFTAHYQRDMLLHPFSDFIEDIAVPILVMQGGRDFQVLADVDFVMIQELLAGRDNTTFKLYDDLNHSFVSSSATNFTEHAADMQTNPGRVEVAVLRDIVDWILG